MFYFLLFLLAFTSVDIIFHKFLELHAVLLVNFFNEFTQTPLPPPTPLMAKIQYVSQKFFVDAPLIVTNNQISCLYKIALCQLI